MNSKNKVVLTSVALIGVLTATAYYQLRPDSSDKPTQTASAPVPVSTPEMAVLPEMAMKAPPAANKSKAPAKPAHEFDDEDAEVLAQPDDNPNFDTFNDRYQNIVSRRAGMEFDPSELYEAMQEPDTWQASAEAPASYELSDDLKNDGRVFISLSPLKLETMARGDKMQIKIPNTNIDFTATINEVRSDNSGTSVTWEGVSDNPESNNKITITKGDTLVVGGIFTDDGLYQLEVKDGQGYIVSNATLFRHGQDQVVEVPQELIDNPPEEYVKLEAETFGGDIHN
ncbi:hypothetical protein TDB9533_00623 [Thalassocella blandensis]|nr:hypothetical protein TDB9533_00623 [Thalassocella blandensis]